MTDKHPSRCICSECQDEALATELQSDKARIAELERENTRLREQLDAGTEAGWHALRNERDALRARIEDAPSRIAEMGAWDVDPQKAFLSAILPQSYAGKRVALVALS